MTTQYILEVIENLPPDKRLAVEKFIYDLAKPTPHPIAMEKDIEEAAPTATVIAGGGWPSLMGSMRGEFTIPDWFKDPIEGMEAYYK